MKLTPRIVVPVLLAAACTALLIIFLWWQLRTATALVDIKSFLPGGTGAVVETPSIADAPIDPRDKALLHLRQGDLFALRGEWESAEREYELSVAEDGGLPALRKLARAQLQRRNISGVESTIRKLRSSGAKPEDILLLESIVALRTGELVQAKNILEAAEDSPQKQYALALLAIVEGNHAAAKDYLTQVTAGWEPALRGNARILLSAYDEFALFPESSDQHLITLLSRALAQVEECELALPLLVQVTALRDNYRDAWIVQGYCELTTERYEQSLASLEHAYGLDPQKPEIQYFLGRTYAALKDYSNAITFYEYAITNGFQPVAEVRRLIAKSALDNNNPSLALQQYEFMTQGDQADIDAYEGYVTVALALGEGEQAYEKAKKALEIWPNEARAHDLVGWTAGQTDRKNEAVDALTRALEINPFLQSAKDHLKEIEG